MLVCEGEDLQRRGRGGSGGEEASDLLEEERVLQGLWTSNHLAGGREGSGFKFMLHNLCM